VSLHSEKSEPIEERRLPFCFSLGLSIRDGDSVSCERRVEEESVWRGMLAGLLDLEAKEGILAAA